MKIKTRFAPSPTGNLHLGGARTALFNWLFAKAHGGEFCLRIDDTDLERSQDQYTLSIIDDLSWFLGSDQIPEPVYQSNNVNQQRYKEIAEYLLNQALAYRCYATAEELNALYEHQKNNNLPQGYDRRWRDNTEVLDRPYCIRIKSQLTGKTVLRDLVQGRVEHENKNLDDFVLVKSDGRPTYMLCSAVDDNHMGITHVIRGVDHLVNTFRQMQIIKAMNWNPPEFAHLALIHDQDGKKLSKRHQNGEFGFYRRLGILPSALQNYLLRLGFSGGREIISVSDVLKIFDLSQVSRSSAMLDLDKLYHYNFQYMKELNCDELIELLTRRNPNLDTNLVRSAAGGLLPRSKTLSHFEENLNVYTTGPVVVDLTVSQLQILGLFAKQMSEYFAQKDFTESNIAQFISEFLKTHNIKMPELGQPLRMQLCGQIQTPPLANFLSVLGKNTVETRLQTIGAKIIDL